MIHDWGGKLGVRDVAVIVVYAERVGRWMREYMGGCQQVSCEIDGFMHFGPALTPKNSGRVVLRRKMYR